METLRASELHPALLPQGTVVGSWRVVAWAGCGVHGAVYRVVPVGQEHSRPLALKLALLPRNPRFAREAQLLSRLHHPHVPRLWEHGDWQHPSGTLHPFLVMDWVDGAPLYDWAWHHNPSSQQVLRLLAQVARALESLHVHGGVHRDVKGDNLLVGHTDGLARLTDFGAGTSSDAASLTPEMLPPSTPAYRAPEAWLFARQFLRDRTACYCAGPADDLYALGVTAYRLVTGEYPELAEPARDEAGLWHLKGLASPAPLVLNPRVSPQLDGLILRMLSMRPEQRGTAAQLAAALEQAAALTSPESTRSLFAQASLPSAAEASALRPRTSSQQRYRQPRCPLSCSAPLGVSGLQGARSPGGSGLRRLQRSSCWAAGQGGALARSSRSSPLSSGKKPEEPSWRERTRRDSAMMQRLHPREHLPLPPRQEFWPKTRRPSRCRGRCDPMRKDDAPTSSSSPSTEDVGGDSADAREVRGAQAQRP